MAHADAADRPFLISPQLSCGHSDSNAINSATTSSELKFRNWKLILHGSMVIEGIKIMFYILVVVKGYMN